MGWRAPDRNYLWSSDTFTTPSLRHTHGAEHQSVAHYSRLSRLLALSGGDTAERGTSAASGTADRSCERSNAVFKTSSPNQDSVDDADRPPGVRRRPGEIGRQGSPSRSLMDLDRGMFFDPLATNAAVDLDRPADARFGCFLPRMRLRNN